MRKLNIEKLQTKIHFEKKPNQSEELAPSSFEVTAVSGNRLYFSKAINPKYFSNFLNITIFLKVANQWKSYQIMDFQPEEDHKEFGKVDCLVLNFESQEKGEKFKYDLEAARC